MAGLGRLRGFGAYGLICGLFVAALALGQAVSADAVDLDAAKTQFLASCGTCHTAEAGAENRQGPNLYNRFGKRAGTLDGFQYSEALKTSGFVWDEATLDRWISNAQEARPGVVMMYRQADPEKRKLIIEYLKSLAGRS